MPVLIGASSNGASVNVAEHNGVRGQMQRALPWLFWSWCFSHRLELACKDSFVSATFLAVQEMLLCLYYLYEKSPKKSRELTTIVEELKGVFELGKGGGYLPIRCQGTRWITHKRNAMQRVVERYDAYILHLTSLINDNSVKAADKAKLRGYLKIWKSPKMLISCGMFFDALKPLSILSLVLQGKEVDVVMGIESTLNSLKSLMSLLEKDPCQWPTVQLFLYYYYYFIIFIIRNMRMMYNTQTQL